MLPLDISVDYLSDPPPLMLTCSHLVCSQLFLFLVPSTYTHAHILQSSTVSQASGYTPVLQNIAQCELLSPVSHYFIFLCRGKWSFMFSDCLLSVYLLQCPLAISSSSHDMFHDSYTPNHTSAGSCD